jgi:hypothetical protein
MVLAVVHRPPQGAPLGRRCERYADMATVGGESPARAAV